MNEIPTKPYFIRALYEWCTDNGYTPYVSVKVDCFTRVPTQYVKEGEIVLNVSYNATSQFKIDNEMMSFYARFSGKQHRIEIPINNIQAIYSRETAQGMSFEVQLAEENEYAQDSELPEDSMSSEEVAQKIQGTGETPKKNHLKIIK